MEAGFRASRWPCRDPISEDMIIPYRWMGTLTVALFVCAAILVVSQINRPG